MGCKRKSIEEYCSEYPDLELKTVKKIDKGDEEILRCKVCKTEVTRQANRITEHLNSKTHLKLKESQTKKTQATMEACLGRMRQRKEAAADFPHDLVRALCFEAIPMNAARGSSYLFALLHKYAPAARTCPERRQLEEKYLPEVFAHHQAAIKELLSGEKFSLVIDETPELAGQPAINALAVFYSDKNKSVNTILLKSSVVLQCNAGVMSVWIQDVLTEYGLTWENCVSINSDSAMYMQRLVKDLKEMHPNLLHIPCIAHLLHVAIDQALKTNQFRNINKFVVHFPAIFKHANKQRRAFFKVCASNNISPSDLHVPPHVVPSHWFSWLAAAKYIHAHWDSVTEFLTKETDAVTSKKAAKLRVMVEDDGNQQELYCKLSFACAFLGKIHTVHLQMETNAPLIHRIDSLLNCDLQVAADVNNALKEVELRAMGSKRQPLSSAMHAFASEFQSNLKATMSRNVPDGLYGSGSVFANCKVFDPFIKAQMSHNYSDYENILRIFPCKAEDFKNEFELYMAREIPNDSNMTALNYWKSET
ncbi:uncharacterized protein LOC135357041 [Latimeria chalumnae]|uniref:uncharacterized protein LOC135357041 n=1 Tax=Latimeria chalumnae TaxID=7897 RepID=UPI00313C3BB2